MSYLVAIQIDTEGSATDTDIGLYSGKLRWVTGLPQYDGATTIPTGAPGNVWKNDMLLEPIGNIVREIDIEQAGDYASLDGFRFKIRNTEQFQVDISTLDINLTNKEVKVWVVINDTFYPCYTGLVKKTPWDELDFEFDCIGKFRKVHAQIPPTLITTNRFPDAPDSSIGKVIPICIGNIAKSEVINVTGEPEIIACAEVGGEPIYAAGAFSYVHSGTSLYVLLVTQDKIFQTNELAGGQYYLKVIRGTEQVVRIKGNMFSGTGLTLIRLEMPLEDGDASTWTSSGKAHTLASITPSTTWFFQIIKMDLKYIVSDKSISAFGTKNGLTALYSYSSDENSYDLISELIESKDESESNSLSHPYIGIASRGSSVNGDIGRYYRIKPESIEYGATVKFGSITLNEFETPSNMAKLVDLDRSTSVRVTANSASFVEIQLYVNLPDSEFIKSFDDLYLCVDLTAHVASRRFQIGVSGLDPYGYEHEETLFPDFNYPISGDYTLSAEAYNFLPNLYYEDGGNDAGQDSLFGAENSGSVVKDKFKSTGTLIESLDTVIMANRLVIQVNMVKSGSSGDIDFSINQIGLVGYKSVNVIKDAVYTSPSGQKLDGSLAETLPDVLELLFTEYDGLGSGDFDLSQLALTRSGWTLSRRLEEQKSSFEYYKELSAQTFIGLWAKRDGVIAGKAWREDAAPSITDNATNIIAGTLQRLEPTDITRIYNDFSVSYNWDPGSKKNTRTLFVTKAWESAFPAPYDGITGDADLAFDSLSWFSAEGGVHDFIITLSSDQGVSIGDYISIFGNGDGYNFTFRQVYAVFDSGTTLYIRGTTAGFLATPSSSGTVRRHTSDPLWKTFVGGVNDYVEAEQLWGQARAGYEAVGAVQRLPKELSECPWFADKNSYEDGTGNDDNNTALKYLTELVAWSTRPKDFVRYQIPITSTTITRELLDSVNFSDAKLTNNVTRLGWIQALELDLQRFRLGVTLILNPLDIIEQNVIIETGSQPDQIVETGSESDIYEET